MMGRSSHGQARNPNPRQLPDNLQRMKKFDINNERNVLYLGNEEPTIWGRAKFGKRLKNATSLLSHVAKAHITTANLDI